MHEPITSPIEAMAGGEDAVWGLDGNVLSTSTYARGDAEAALAQATHVVSETFQTQRVDHAFLEPESTLAVPVPAAAAVAALIGLSAYELAFVRAGQLPPNS